MEYLERKARDPAVKQMISEMKDVASGTIDKFSSTGNLLLTITKTEDEGVYLVSLSPEGEVAAVSMMMTKLGVERTWNAVPSGTRVVDLKNPGKCMIKQ